MAFDLPKVSRLPFLDAGVLLGTTGEARRTYVVGDPLIRVVSDSPRRPLLSALSRRHKAHRRPWRMISAVSVTAVEGFEVAHVRGEGGPERVRIDGPPGLVLGVPVTMLFDQSV